MDIRSRFDRLVAQIAFRLPNNETDAKVLETINSSALAEHEKARARARAAASKVTRWSIDLMLTASGAMTIALLATAAYRFRDDAHGYSAAPEWALLTNGIGWLIHVTGQLRGENGPIGDETGRRIRATAFTLIITSLVIGIRYLATGR